MAEMDDDELLDALGVDVTPLKATSRTPREERVIAGFEDILRFYQAHGRAPLHGEGRDIFERLYAVRLDRLRNLRLRSDLGRLNELLNRRNDRRVHLDHAAGGTEPEIGFLLRPTI